MDQQTQHNQISVEDRKLQILTQRIAEITAMYENTLMQLQIEKEVTTQRHAEEKRVWDGERKTLLDKIQALQNASD